MARVRSVLLTLTVRPAGRRCSCKRSKKHQLLKGDARFIVKAPGIATSEDGYCAECALEMIDAARRTLDHIESELRGQQVESGTTASPSNLESAP